MLTKRQLVEALRCGRAPLSALADEGNRQDERSLGRVDRAIHALEGGQVPLSKEQRTALRMMLNYGIENSCTCGDPEYSNRRGFEGHASDCAVTRFLKKHILVIRRMLGEE